MNSKHTYMRMKNIKSFIRANLEGLKAHQRALNVKDKRQDSSLFQVSQNTIPNLQDFLT